MKDSVCVNDRKVRDPTNQQQQQKKNEHHHKKVNSTKYLNGFWIQKL